MLDNEVFLDDLTKVFKDLNIDSKDITYSIDENKVVFLEGYLNKYEDVVALGHSVAKINNVKNVVCNVKYPEYKEKVVDTSVYENLEIIDEADVVIIGGGVIGCGIARQLSKYNLDILLLEKCEDISCGTTKSNNGMIHSGYDSKNGTLKAKLNVLGNEKYTKWSEELGFKFDRTGSFVCGFNDKDLEVINNYFENGTKNKVPGIKVITGDMAREIEPNLSDNITYALWTPSAGYVEPYEVCLALMENAIDNGARLRLDHEVLKIEVKDNKATTIMTNKGKIKCRHVINAAGLYSDEVAQMVDDKFYTIHPRQGAIIIFDKENKGKLTTFSGVAPSGYSKGGGPQQTPEGTLLWGPSAREVYDKENLDVENEDIDFIIEKGLMLTKNIDKSTLITYFSGNRAATYKEDFVIENSTKVQNFTHVSGIQSPGLASAPAICEMVEELFLSSYGKCSLDKNYNPIRKYEKPFRDCNIEEREELINNNCAYGNVICRCETVTEAEIVNAIHSSVPATTIDSIKRRTRAGMGRCQSGFCQSKVLKILARELNISPLEVTLKGEGSEILKSNTRGSEKDLSEDMGAGVLNC